jgi:hypothetical protein
MQTQTDAQRRKAQRERTAKRRQKIKEQEAGEFAAAEQRRREERCKARLAVSGEVAAPEEFLFAEYMHWRRTERLVFPGEVAPDENAQTCADALLVAREFLAALHKPGIKSGETLLDIEHRVLNAWAAAGGPLLNRNTRKLETSVAGPAFDFDFDKWTMLDGADLPIVDIAPLPAIVVPTPAVSDSLSVEVPAVDTADTVVPAVVPAVHIEVPELDTAVSDSLTVEVQPTIEATIREERASSSE